MKYVVDFVENKNPDWKVAQLIGDGGAGAKLTDVSINRSNKKGEVFPNFDGITPGASIEGEPWQSAAGKWYLFSPKPEKASGGAYRGNGGASKTQAIEKAQDRKEGMIKDAQDRKEESIAFFNSTNSALQLLSSDPLFKEAGDEEKKSAISYWRDWFYGQWFTHEGASEPFKS